MNKRQFKKLKNKQFYKYISEVSSNGVVILSFDINKIRPQQLEQFANIFKNTIDNKFILLPKDMIQFEKCVNKEKYIEMLENIIANLKHEDMLDKQSKYESKSI